MTSTHSHRDYSITVPCPHHGSHGPYDFTGRDDIVIRNSKRLGHQFETGEHHISFDYPGRDYSCSTLNSIIETWKDQEYHPPQDVDDLEILFQLSKALWEYKCDLKLFEKFADAVKMRHWKNHFQQGSHSNYWAFIALVFGWRDIFALASMDIPSLGESLSSHHLRRNEDEVLRKIVGVCDYCDQRSQTFEFIRNTCCKLETTKEHRKISEWIRNYFEAKNIKILAVEEDSIEHIRKYGVVGLLRMFKSCLMQDSWTIQPQRDNKISIDNRFTRESTIWNSISRWFRNEEILAKPLKQKLNPIREVLLSKIQEHQESDLNCLLERKPLIRQRFTSFRAANLILSDENRPQAGKYPGEGDARARTQPSPRADPKHPKRILDDFPDKIAKSIVRDAKIARPPLGETMPLRISEQKVKPRYPNEQVMSRDRISHLIEETLQEKFTGIGIHSARFIVDWELPRYCRDELEGVYNLSPVVTVCGDEMSAYAVTCKKYVREHWPDTKLVLIKLLQEVLSEPWKDHQAKEGDLEIFVSSFTEDSECRNNFIVTGSRNNITSIAQQLAWLAMYFRFPLRGKLALSKGDFWGSSGELPTFFIHLHPLNDVPRNHEHCWHLMMKNFVVAHGFPIPTRDFSERGIEIPFELMTTLGNIWYPKEYLGGIVLKGFSTVIVPVDLHGTSVQWHFLHNENKREMLHMEAIYERCPDIKIVEQAKFEDITSTDKRHFLGYAEEAKISLGTKYACFESVGGPYNL